MDIFDWFIAKSVVTCAIMAKVVPAKTDTELSVLLERTGMNCADFSEKFDVSKRTAYRWRNGETGSSPSYPRVIKELREIDKKINSETPLPQEPDFTFIDLFAGIGGFRKAFDTIGGKCVFTSEWDKNCRLTYQENYTCDHSVVGDIREYTKDEESLARIPKHDVLVGGFPCQPFSIAGVSKKNSLGKLHGFKCDTQGTLFFDLAQIIEFHRPPAILLENVKNLMSHDGGKTFKVIKRTLEEELGYKISCKVLDGQHWVPQHRERIFIVGFRKDVGFSFDDLEIPQEKMKLGSILHRTDGTEESETPFFENGEVASKYTLSEHLWSYLQKYKEKHLAKGNGFGYGLFGPDDVARTLSARYYKDGAEILIKQDNTRPRRLTPRECARIMGFDGPSENNFKIPVSDTQAYRQFGNSVIVPCASAVARLMKPYILSAISNDGQLTIPFEGRGNELKAAYA